MWKDHPVFEKPQSPEVPVWRYMDFTQFISLLERQALFFCRIDRLEDPFEGYYSNVNHQYGLDLWLQFAKSITPPDKYESALEQNIANYKFSRNRDILRRSFTLVNCWHLNSGESEAMWKLHIRGGEGIAIRSTFDRLCRCFSQCDDVVYVGKVQYVDYDTTYISDGNAFSPFMHKRLSFEHEKEVRALVSKVPSDTLLEEAKIDGAGDYLPVDLNTLIEYVYVAPTTASWVRELVQVVLERYGIDRTVVQSSLDDRPPFELETFSDEDGS